MAAVFLKDKIKKTTLDNAPARNAAGFRDKQNRNQRKQRTAG